MRNHRANANAVFLLRDLIESRHRLQIDKEGIMHRPLFHKNHKRGATRDGPRLIAVLHQKLARFRKRARLQKIEGSDGHDLFFDDVDTSSNRLVS
jgi:hypothetical protein